jgi:pilin isopeptide linkage protein
MGEGEGPQTFVLIDTVAHDGTTWTPSGTYVPGVSNYEVVYCCDVETMIVDGTYYKRLNLEDNDYYDDEQAAKIRAILTHAYPYVSVEAMKAELAAQGFENAQALTRNEIIAAVQTAVWACANGEVLRYQKSYRVSDNLQWGYPMHDTSNESGLDVSGKRVFKTYEEVGARIDSLVDYLLALDAVKAAPEQIVITQLDIVDAVPVQEKNGVCNVALQVALNNSGSCEQDELVLTVAVDGTVVKTEAIKLGTKVYDVTVEAKPGQVIEAVVSGTQILPLGTYFYEPEGGRKVSQTLVGVASGKTDVYADASVTLEIEEADTHGKLVLQKTNVRGKALAGAEFALYIERENASICVGTYAVDENGMLVITDLLPGNYKLVETIAPAGYSLLETPISFTVNDSETAEITLADEIAGVELVDGVLTVKNTPAPSDSTSVKVDKVWVDKNDQDGIRPDSITINLLANGEQIDSAVLNEANGWQHIFADLEKFFNGEEIVYTIVEEAVEGYTSVITGNSNDGFVVTNTHIASTSIVIEGIKYLDEEVASGFDFVLVDAVNGTMWQAQSGEDGKFAFDKLVFTEAGKYVYTIAEVIGDNEDIIYDETVYTVTVIVTQENHALHADMIVTVEEAAHEGEIRFDNTTLTDIPDEDPPLEELPTTGDMGMAPMVTALVSMMSLAAVVTIGKKKEII